MHIFVVICRWASKQNSGRTSVLIKQSGNLPRFLRAVIHRSWKRPRHRDLSAPVHHLEQTINIFPTTLKRHIQRVDRRIAIRARLGWELSASIGHGGRAGDAGGCRV